MPLATPVDPTILNGVRAANQSRRYTLGAWSAHELAYSRNNTKRLSNQLFSILPKRTINHGIRSPIAITAAMSEPFVRIESRSFNFHPYKGGHCGH